MHPQIPLPLNLAPARSFDSFHAGPTGAAMLQSVQTLAGAPKPVHRQIYLWGAGACGKTHLLGAACQMATDAGYRVAWLPLERIGDAGMFEGIEHASLVCIDNVHLLAPELESVMFHAMNRCRNAARSMLVSAALPPHELGVALPDLRTRLEWGAVFRLPVPDEPFVRAVMARQLEARGLLVHSSVLDYLLRRLPRDLPTIVGWVEALDRAALSHQRRLTIPLVSQLLHELGEQPATDHIRPESCS